MGVSFAELRRVCQLPVRENNDVAGLVYGDFASLPITKLFVDLKISPSVATIGFLIAGLLGSVLHAGSGTVVVAAAALLILYYLLDCVDGEVARWFQVTDIRWGYYDCLFHMLVKPLAFLGVGIGTFLEFGNPWLLVAAFAAATAALWLKIFLATPGMIFVRAILTDPEGKAREFSDDVDRTSTPDPGSGGGFPLGFNVTTARALMTNFDIGLPLLLAATIGDLFAGPFDVPLLGLASFRALWLVYYAVVLPVDFADHLFTYLRRGHFQSEVNRLVGLAHHFRVGDDA